MAAAYAGRNARVHTYCLSHLLLLQFLNGAVRLIYGAVGVRVGVRIRVRDRQPAEGLAGYLARGLAAFEPELVEQRIVFIGVAVRPAVNGDFQDVAGGVESAGT